MKQSMALSLLKGESDLWSIICSAVTYSMGRAGVGEFKVWVGEDMDSWHLLIEGEESVDVLRNLLDEQRQTTRKAMDALQRCQARAVLTK